MGHERGKESDRTRDREAPDARARRSGDAGGSRASDPPEAEAEGALGGFTELVRRAFAAGFSSFFFTEEALRKALGDTLPKDWADFASEQSARTRSEVIERVSFEVGRAVERVDWAAALAALLEGRTLEVRAEIRLGEKTEDGRSRLQIDFSRSRGS